MKRISLLLLIIVSNLSIISCTEESLADVVDNPQDHYANDGDEDKTDPEVDPIGG
ncbi:hypothetical protein [Christiangramia sp.]|uniref:hypothetical protein n=1 Tax=Christiangramia sp. TaxID=1931228 RepID=UPI002621F2B0|nr:hypothetical protein [Christiangramia sp.]